MVYDTFSSLESFLANKASRIPFDPSNIVLLEETASYPVNPRVTYNGREMLYSKVLEKMDNNEIVALLQEVHDEKP